jgi:hypothetical protein
LSCNAGISIGDFRAVTANHHRQTGALRAMPPDRFISPPLSMPSAHPVMASSNGPRCAKTTLNKRSFF